MATAVKQPSKTALKNAARLLQKAHDFIEVNGFIIDEYGDNIVGKFRSVPKDLAPMCYIGTVRSIAGINPTPGCDGNGSADEGDGPELTIALEAMDKVAKSRLDSGAKDNIRQGYENRSVGRFVEELGFEVRNRAVKRYPHSTATGSGWYAAEEALCEKREAYEQDYALKLLRKALTVVYR